MYVPVSAGYSVFSHHQFRRKTQVVCWDTSSQHFINSTGRMLSIKIDMVVSYTRKFYRKRISTIQKVDRISNESSLLHTYIHKYIY